MKRGPIEALSVQHIEENGQRSRRQEAASSERFAKGDLVRVNLSGWSGEATVIGCSWSPVARAHVVDVDIDGKKRTRLDASRLQLIRRAAS